MKRILAIVLSLLSLTAMATTLSPIQLLNPAGSTSGQMIASTGPTTAPAWSNVVATTLASQAANTVVANVTGSAASPTAFAMPSCSTSTSALQWTSATGFTCYANSASLAGATFTGATGVAYSNAAFALNDTSASNKTQVTFQKNGTTAWALSNSSTANTLAIDRFVSGSYVDSPLSISNSTGAVTMSDGITGSPISGSTGSFTTLSASSTFTVPSGTALNQPNIVGVTNASSAAAGSVGEYISNSATVISLTTATPANITSINLTAGDWDVSGLVQFSPAGTTVMSLQVASINTVSATVGGLGNTANINITAPAGSGSTVNTPTVRVNVSSTTTVFLVSNQTFTTSTATANGLIRARRVR